MGTAKGDERDPIQTNSTPKEQHLRILPAPDALLARRAPADRSGPAFGDTYGSRRQEVTAMRPPFGYPSRLTRWR